MEGFDIINLRLMSHPVNWVFVWVILALALIGYGAIHDGLARQPSNVSTGAF